MPGIFYDEERSGCHRSVDLKDKNSSLSSVPAEILEKTDERDK